MLKPKELQNLPKGLTDIYLELSEFVLRDIARRIAKAAEITDTAEYQLYRARALGLSTKEITAEIARINGVAESEIEKIIREAAEKSDEFDRRMLSADGAAVTFSDNEELQALMSAEINNTRGQCKNYTGTLGFAEVNAAGNVVYSSMTDFLRKQMDMAHMKVASGVTDYNTAIRQACKALSDSGLRTVYYESGRSDRIEVAVRRALMTSVSQVTQRISEQNAEEFGADGWEITAHIGARPSHAVYQGKQFPNSQYELIVRPLIEDYNCRHDAFPIKMGISQPVYTEEELANIDSPPFTYEGRTYTAYQAQQQMRKMERAMRKQKDRCIAAEAAGDKDAFTAASIKLRRQKDIYEDFCKAAGTYTEYERTFVQGYDRHLAGKTGAVTRKQNAFKNAQVTLNQTPPLTNGGNGGKIKERRASALSIDGTAKHYVHKIGSIDASNKNEVDRMVTKFEKRYAESDREHCLIIRPNGDVYVARGDEYSVNTSELMGEKMRGCFTSHNHPPQTTQYSFSVEDFSATLSESGKRMRAFDFKYEYEAVFPDKLISEDDLYEAYYSAFNNKSDLFGESGLSLDDYEENIQHLIILSTCKRLGINYRRKRHD